MVMRMALVHTAEQAAAIIGGNCKASWLREKARLLEIPHTMISGAYHFTGAHLDEIVRAFERLPQPAPAKRTPGRPVAAANAPVTMLTARTPRRRKPAA